ncbi:meiosis expressed gene 1 protein homolog, partial [Crassostrea angulata]|uniref:meiosis expressed gene 1 protein homolog n=1 Tax=Magallana angulata TaxID=2784310 RepID=UPI0022B0DA3B
IIKLLDIFPGVYRITNMSVKPTKMVRATSWSDDVEEAYRFQLAGYRDAQDYAVCKKAETDRWPHNGYIKKLIRKDGCWYYESVPTKMYPSANYIPINYLLPLAS